MLQILPNDLIWLYGVRDIQLLVLKLLNFLILHSEHHPDSVPNRIGFSELLKNKRSRLIVFECDPNVLAMFDIIFVFNKCDSLTLLLFLKDFV